jgi:hypothetical protein
MSGEAGEIGKPGEIEHIGVPGECGEIRETALTPFCS